MHHLISDHSQPHSRTSKSFHNLTMNKRFFLNRQNELEIFTAPFVTCKKKSNPIRITSLLSPNYFIKQSPFHLISDLLPLNALHTAHEFLVWNLEEIVILCMHVVIIIICMQIRSLTCSGSTNASSVFLYLFFLQVCGTMPVLGCVHHPFSPDVLPTSSCMQ